MVIEFPVHTSPSILIYTVCKFLVWIEGFFLLGASSGIIFHYTAAIVKGRIAYGLFWHIVSITISYMALAFVMLQGMYFYLPYYPKWRLITVTIAFLLGDKALVMLMLHRKKT